MSIFYEIADKARIFEVETGKAPTLIYFGREDWDRLRLEVEAQMYMVETQVKGRAVMGLKIHLTDDENHCRVGI